MVIENENRKDVIRRIYRKLKGKICDSELYSRVWQGKMTIMRRYRTVVENEKTQNSCREWEDTGQL